MFSTELYSQSQPSESNQSSQSQSTILQAERSLQELFSDQTTLKQVRVGILGVGRWGSHLLRNFLNHPAVTVKAVIDPFVDNLTRAKEWVDDTSTVEWLIDWQAMFSVGLDAIVVATPAETHYPIIKAALQQGIHVLAEKPLTLTVAEARELCTLAEASQVQLVVDHTYLFHPAVLRDRSRTR